MVDGTAPQAQEGGGLGSNMEVETVSSGPKPLPRLDGIPSLHEQSQRQRDHVRRTNRQRIRHRLKHGKHSLTAPSPLPSELLLGQKAAASLGKRSQAMHDMERSIAGSVDERIIVLSRVLPQEMLKGKMLGQFLQKQGISNLNAIADRLFNTIRRDAWKIWVEHTLELREAALEEKLAQFAQQGGMRKLKRMFAKAMNTRAMRMWGQWVEYTVESRLKEQTPPAITIQSVMRMYLSWKTTCRHYMASNYVYC